MKGSVRAMLQGLASVLGLNPALPKPNIQPTTAGQSDLDALCGDVHRIGSDIQCAMDKVRDGHEETTARGILREGR